MAHDNYKASQPNELANTFTMAEITSCGGDKSTSSDAKKVAAGIISGGFGLGAIEAAGGLAALDMLSGAGPEIACLGAMGVLAAKYMRSDRV